MCHWSWLCWVAISIELSKYFKTTGLDISKSRIKNLNKQNDSNNLINKMKKNKKKYFLVATLNIKKIIQFLYVYLPQ